MKILDTTEKAKGMQYLTGRVISMNVGECAYIRVAGKEIRTSTVVTIVKNNDGVSLFETRNSFYCVTAPEPIAAVSGAILAETTYVGNRRNAEQRGFYLSALSELMKKWRIKHAKEETR